MTVASAEKSQMQGVPKPDDGPFRRQIEAINSKVAEIQTELTEIQEKIRAVQEGGAIGDLERKTQIRLKLNSTQDRIQVLDNSRRAHQERLADYQRAITQYNAQVQSKRNGLQFQSLDSVKQRVVELQNTLSRTNLSLPDEKAAIREISQLKQKIPLVKSALKEVETLEANRPDYSMEMEASQKEMENIRLEVETERRRRRELQDELKQLTSTESDERSKRNEILDELISRRETLTEERDAQTTILLEAHNAFNDQLVEYRDYEAKKRQAQQERLRERKRLERQEIERKELQDQIAGCVVEDDGSEDGGQRLLQLFNYCHTQLEKLGKSTDSGSPKKQKKKEGVDITIIGEFGTYGIPLPATAEDYEAAIKILEPLYEKECSANDKVRDAVAVRRAALQAKLDLLEQQIVRELSPKKADK